MERIITIELFGEQFKFKAEAEDNNAQKVVEYLKAKVDDVKDTESSSNREIGKFAHLLLATLNICNDYFELKEKHDALTHAVHERSSKIAAKIEKSFT